MNKLKELPENLTLYSGAHNRGEEMCVMEAVAYVAGEEWSDSPKCACPVIATFLRTWNDAMPSNDDRDRLLKPLIPRIVGTKSTPEIEFARSMLCVDWLIRNYLPTWMELTPGLQSLAAELRAHRPLQAWTDFDSVVQIISAARSAAESAARSAAKSAAESAAYSAAGSEAYSAAYSAARSEAESAAGSAAYSAAYSAARSEAGSEAYSAARSAAESAAYSAAKSAAESAAYSAAKSAVYSAVAPTVSTLQQSAVDVIARMIAIKEELSCT